MKQMIHRAAVCVLAGAAMWMAALPLRAQDEDATPGRGKYFVATVGNDAWSGLLPLPNADKSDGPLATIGKAVEKQREAGIRCTIFIRTGTYHLSEPIALTPADSGLKLLAYPQEKPVVSGGRLINGWKQSQNPNIWTAAVPEARGGRWPIRLLRVGNELQPKARHPNVDPANPYQGGWSFVTSDGARKGALGAAVSMIHNPGDWIEWQVNFPTDGQYRLWFLYAAANARSKYRVTDMADRTTVQLDGGAPIGLKELQDSPRNRWSHVADLTSSQGDHILRWTNVKGGYINLDALVVTDDLAWNPTVGRPGAGKSATLVQAEVIAASECKEMVVPEVAGSAARDRFQFKPGDMKQYRSPQTEVHMIPGTGEASTILHYLAVDLGNRTVRVDPRVNAVIEIRPGNRYFMANALEDLDSPGEWFLDASGGNLYYWPKVPTFERLGVVASSLDRLVEFKGDHTKDEWVEEVIIKGLEFCDTTYSRVFSPVAPDDAAIWLSGARRCVIEGNLFVNLGGHAVRVDKQSSKNEIVGNHIADAGQGGVLLKGDSSSQPRDTLIAGNWMERLGTIVKHVGGVTCQGATGTRVAHNRIEKVPRWGIAFKSLDARNASNNNVAEYNDIREACMETAGSGGIEVLGRHKADTGNILRYNRIMDVVGLATSSEGAIESPTRAAGIYLDEYASGVTVQGNVLVRSPLGGVVINGGRNNVIENNIFVDGGDQQILLVARDAFAEKNRIVKNIFHFTSPKGVIYKGPTQWQPKLVSEVDYNVFSHAQGATYLQGQPVTPVGTVPQWQAGNMDRNSQVAAPGFTDPARDNYQLQNNSPALGLGFSQIPMDQIGLQGFDRSWKQ